MLYSVVMSSPKVVLVGHVCVDHNKSEHATYESWGSSVLYMATSFHKQFGLHPLAISSYGPDLLPYLPDVQLLPASPNQPNTLVYENNSTSGKRVQHCHNIGSAGPPELSADEIQMLREADIIVVATLLPNYSADYLRTLLANTKPNVLKVLCPQGYFRHITKEGRVEPRDFAEAADVVPLFDIVMYSEEDYPQAFELAKTWKQRMDTEVIVTQSAAGATIVSKDQDKHIPTTPIAAKDIVDSVGCGDTFAAAVTYSFYRSHNLPEAILDGHHAATKKLLSVPTKV